MNFLTFQNTFSHLRIIPKIEIKKRFPDFDWNALTRWQKKGYIVKIRNGYYRFAQQKIRGDVDLFFIANQIYQPSYISLESALSYYNLIPEGVFMITSVSTKKTQHFFTPNVEFSYRSVRKEAYIGYQIFPSCQFKIAYPSKAILDMLYLKPNLFDNEDDFFEWRLNIFELQEQISWEKFETFLKLYRSKALIARAKRFRKFINSMSDEWDLQNGYK